MKKIIDKGYKDKLKYVVCSNRETMGKLAADIAAEQIKGLLNEKDFIRIIFAAAPSQNEFLHYLTSNKEINWSKIIGFHMDEYLGLPHDSNQWFKIYLQKKITNNVRMKEFHFIDGTAPKSDEVKRYTGLLQEASIDMVCLGVGENGHIAFNDPPVADFNDPKLVKVVELDQPCRQQQVNDGCFPTIQSVPTHAITLTIPALLSAQSMICTVPGPNKRAAISNLLNEPISTACPASIMKKHANAHLILDTDAYGG